MPSIEELRARHKAGERTPRPRKTVTVTLVEGQHLADEWTRLNNEKLDLLVEAQRVDDEGEQTGPPKKAGEGLPPRVEEITAEQVALNARMAEFQGELTIEARPYGEWLRWVEEHPPRKDNDVDERLALSQCNALDLLDDLGTYAAEWDGDALGEGDWDALELIHGDYQELISEVVKLHELRFMRAPKSPSGSSGTPTGSSDSNSPETSESQNDDS